MRQSTQTKQGFVIHSRPYRESSLLLELLLDDSSYATGIARGVRNPNGQSIDLLSQYEFTWRGTSQLLTFTQWECVRTYRIVGKPLYSTLYLNELLKKAMKPGGNVDGLFQAYRGTLVDFENGTELVEGSLRRFEKGLLKGLGYELVFDFEAGTGDSVDSDCHYQLVLGSGFRRASEEQTNAFDGSSLLAIANDDYSQERTRRAAKLILRDALRFHIGTEELKSRSLFRTAAV